MRTQENEAIAIGEVSVLQPPDGEIGGKGKGRVLALTLDGVRPPEALPSSKWLRYQWRLRIFREPMPKLAGVWDTTVFMVVTKLKGTGTLDLSVTAKLLAPYESLLKHHENIWNQRGGILQDTLLADWTRTLLANLDDPATRGNVALLKPEHRRRLDAFMQQGELPDPLDRGFLEALREVLSGLVKVVVRTGDVKAALLAGGSPASPAEMKQRFDRYLDGLARGQEPDKVRLVLE